MEYIHQPRCKILKHTQFIASKLLRKAFKETIKQNWKGCTKDFKSANNNININIIKNLCF